jgi:hypothetical protein
MTSSFRLGVNEVFALLECYAALNGSYVLTFRYSMSVPKRLDYLTLKNRTDRLRLNVGNYRYRLRNIPKERRPDYQLLRKDFTQSRQLTFRRKRQVFLSEITQRSVTPGGNQQPILGSMEPVVHRDYFKADRYCMAENDS